VKKDKTSETTTQKTSEGITISVPRQFTDVGVVHAVVLTLGAIFVGGLMQWGFKVPALIPASITAHPALLMWTVYLVAYGLFLLLCVSGFGSDWIGRFGGLGQRGSFVALMMYAVQAKVTPEDTTITQTWLIRKSTCRFKTSEITGIEANECGLTVSTSNGRQETIWFSLYPPTVKKLRRELLQALGLTPKKR
jgi:hypothetical protein